MRILTFAASNSKNSINKKLVNFAASFFTGHEITYIDINDFEMPIYSADRELEKGIPELAYSFSEIIYKSDLIIISFAEHNGAYSAAFKNIFDWLSRIPGKKVWGNKPMFLLATSPGSRGGSSVLEMATKRFPFNGGRVLETFSLPNFNENFDEVNGITVGPYLTELEEEIKKIKDAV